MFKKILVPIENVAHSQKAIDVALDFAARYEATIVLFNAQDIAPAFLWADEPIVLNHYEYNPEKIAEQIVKEGETIFTAKGIPVTLRTAIGDAAHGILETAEAEGCDLIIMCTHGMKPVKRFLLGSVTDKVVHHAQVTVLVVR